MGETWLLVIAYSSGKSVQMDPRALQRIRHSWVTIVLHRVGVSYITGGITRKRPVRSHASMSRFLTGSKIILLPVVSGSPQWNDIVQKIKKQRNNTN